MHKRVYHYNVHVPHFSNLPRDERLAKRREIENALTHYVTRTQDLYFTYTDGDEAGEREAKRLAEEKAADLRRKSGLELHVSKGCFL